MIKKLTDIPYRKRPSSKQQETAKKVKRIATSPRVRQVRYGGKRKEVSLGEFEPQDLAGAVKDFRLKEKLPMQIELYKNGARVARSYFSPARGSSLEAQTIKLASKYNLKGPIEIVAIVWDKSKGKQKPAPAKKAAKKPAKKAAKKPAKKAAKKPTKQTTQKGKKK